MQRFDIKESNIDGFGLECNMASDNCTHMWLGSNWNITNSLKDKYGYVLDERWEGKLPPKLYEKILDLLSK